MKTARKPPRKPRSIGYAKAVSTSEATMDDAEEPPPDPMPSLECHCLLQDLDWHKLILLLNGHPAARGTALLLQAIRQQMSVASVQDYAKNALDWIIENDVLTLKMKKNSVVRRVLQAEGVDSREQMARLINTMASYPRGRQYFTTHLKSFLPCVVAILRGKRLPSTTHDQLIACIQKMSVRQSAQKELLQCGMLEWAIAHFEQKLNNYALEYLSALFINLSTNHLSHPMIMRYADSIAAAVISVLNRGSHGAACSINNTFVLASLNCSRVRLRARETRLYEALKYRTEGRRSCPLCNLHVPYLLAVITNDAEIIRVPLTPTDAESDTLGTSCEREVDSLDPLHPSTNELSGARLLIRRALKENHGGSEEQTPVPGQVPYRNTLRNTPSAASKRGKSEPRIGTATSQHTFVVETERRRPLMMNIGLGEGAMEYKKLLDAQEKAREEEERKKRVELEKAEAEAAEKEKERQKALRHLQLTSRKAPSLLKKELSSSITQLKENSKKALPSKPSSKTPLRKSPITNSGTGSSASIDLDSEAFNKRIVEQESFDDYSAVFGARPKVARTPDTQSRSFF